MFCNMCGANIPDGVDFCPNCGADLRQFKQPEQQSVQPEQAAADAAAQVQEEMAAQIDEVKDAAAQAAAAESMPQQISSASTTPMMDMPLADAPDDMDPESGTTVLTMDMSGPLASDIPSNGFVDDAISSDPFAAPEPEPVAPEPAAPVTPEPAAPVASEPVAPTAPEPVASEAPTQAAPEPAPSAQASNDYIMGEIREHQPQAPEGKVVTPAPVTGSSILSDSSVAPVAPTAQAQPAPAPVPAPAPAPVPQAQQNVQAGGYAAQQAGGFNPYPQAGAGQGITVINQMQSNEPSEEYKPISPWGYLGYTLLFNIPLVGLILMFVWGFGSGTNKNLKNYARFFLLTILISIIIGIIIGIISAITGAAILSSLSDY